MSVRIAVADDHAMFREGLERLLTSTEGMEVVGRASNGAEALSVVVSQKPDVLLLDISMPDMNGLEVARKLRGTVKVVFLTMHENGGAFLPLIRQGIAHGYILKNNAFEELIEAIRTVMRGGWRVSSRVMEKESDQVRERLTLRELEVLRLTSRGMTTRSAARELGVSVKTVENHRANIMDKMKVANMAEAVARRAENGVL